MPHIGAKAQAHPPDRTATQAQRHTSTQQCPAHAHRPLAPRTHTVSGCTHVCTEAPLWHLTPWQNGCGLTTGLLSSYRSVCRLPVCSPPTGPQVALRRHIGPRLPVVPVVGQTDHVRSHPRLTVRTSTVDRLARPGHQNIKPRIHALVACAGCRADSTGRAGGHHGALWPTAWPSTSPCPRPCLVGRLRPCRPCCCYCHRPCHRHRHPPWVAGPYADSVPNRLAHAIGQRATSEWRTSQARIAANPHGAASVHLPSRANPHATASVPLPSRRHARSFWTLK